MPYLGNVFGCPGISEHESVSVPLVTHPFVSSTWFVPRVLHGANPRSCLHLHLLVHDSHVASSWLVSDIAGGATFGAHLVRLLLIEDLDVAASRLVASVVEGADLGAYLHHRALLFPLKMQRASKAHLLF